MFSSNTIVSTVSYSDGQLLSYEEFISSHQEKHDRNVSIAQTSSSKKNVKFYNKNKKPDNEQHGGRKKNGKFIKQQQYNKNGKFIKQQPSNNINRTEEYTKGKPRDNNQHYIKSKVNRRQKNGTIRFILKYLINNKESYPVNKILSHLGKSFNNDIKNSFYFNSFDIKQIQVKDFNKERHNVAVYVNIRYDSINNNDINKLGDMFEMFPCYDRDTKINFCFTNFKIT